MKKSLLLFADYFYPEVAATSLLYTELCEDLATYFDITVICTVPCYIGEIQDKYKTQRYYYEEYKGVKIIRVRVHDVEKENKISRVRHFLSYYWNARSATRKLKKHDIIIATSEPPILGGMLGEYAKRKLKSKFIYNIHDFNPEQAEVTNYLHGKLLIKIARWLDNQSCKKSDLIILDSRDMQINLENRFRGRTVPKSIIIENWVDLNKVHSIVRDDNILFDRFSLHRELFYVSYAGNIGIMQDLPTVIKGAEILESDYPQIRFVIIGDGAWKKKMMDIIKQKGLTNVLVFPMQPSGQESYIYSLGDIELVSIGKNVTKCSMPSKTWKICAAGSPVICQADINSSLAQKITEFGWGICIEPGDVQNFAQTVIDLYKKREILPEMGKKARNFAENYLSREIAVKRYYDTIVKLL
jgi:glycosyltransferase involved in cell wall biosynthesis